MAIDPIGAGPTPRRVWAPDPIRPTRTTQGESSPAGADAAVDVLPRPSLPPAAPPPKVELSFHSDLRTLITRVVDASTGNTLNEFPAREVLDAVAHLIRTSRAREEG